MAKFDNSQYQALWSNEGRLVMQAILQNKDLIKSNYTFWNEKFAIDPEVTPTAADGTAQFRSQMREIEPANMMHMRAPLADSITSQKGNERFYTGPIPDFIGDAYVETAMEREYKEKLFEQFGDAQLIASYAVDFLQRALDGANMTLSYQAAQLLSCGYVSYNQGQGIQGGIFKADIPTTNFLKAGTKVWTDTDCKLLDQLRELVEKANDTFGIEISWQLEITENMWKNVFLNNSQVIEWVRYTKSLNNVLLPETMQMTSDMVKEAISSFEGLPTIVIVKEKQHDSMNGIVRGWKNDNVAVLRPIGKAGYIRHTANYDARINTKYKNNLYALNYTTALNGLLTIENSVVPNGKFKEWHSVPMMQAIPTLDEFLYHCIINTSVAGTFFA